MPYLSRESLTTALNKLKGTANHMLKIWLTLKQMGLSADTAIEVDTANPQMALERLFSYGNPTGDFFVPFAHTRRFQTMKFDAGRSIIQTNLVRWAVSGSVVGVDPTDYLDLRQTESGNVEVRFGRYYPRGLGHGTNGFAMAQDARVVLPLLSFCVWYYRQSDIPDTLDIVQTLRQQLTQDLHLSAAELELVAITDTPAWSPSFQTAPLSNEQIFQTVERFMSDNADSTEVIFQESYEQHVIKVHSMISISDGPSWLRIPPETQLKTLLDNGAKAVLLYGPPRTGKTKAVDVVFPRDDPNRETIQIHDGWGYDELIIGLRPQADGSWAFREGPLLTAIRAGKACIVLEEINRTDFSQAIGEVFSLIEESYRGQDFKIRLRNGEEFYLPENLVIVCTMNTLDRSTETIDDALFGRMPAVEFPPRIESLHTMLAERGVHDETARRLRELFATIQQYYPLGHGYFADFRSTSEPVQFYLNRIRPVLQKHLQNFRDQELAAIDEKVDQLFGAYGDMGDC